MLDVDKDFYQLSVLRPLCLLSIMWILYIKSVCDLYIMWSKLYSYLVHLLSTLFLDCCCGINIHIQNGFYYYWFISFNWLRNILHNFTFTFTVFDHLDVWVEWFSLAHIEAWDEWFSIDYLEASGEWFSLPLIDAWDEWFRFDHIGRFYMETLG